MPEFDIAEIRWTDGIHLIRHRVKADNVIRAVDEVRSPEGPFAIICGGYIKSRGQVWVDRNIVTLPANILVDVDADGAVHIHLTNAEVPQNPASTFVYEYDPQADDYRMVAVNPGARAWGMLGPIEEAVL